MCTRVGNLYKEAWPLLSSTTDGQKTTYYTAQLRTNADAEAWNNTGPDVSRLVEFANALEAAADDYTLTSVLREYTAAAKWAAYFAVDRMIEHWDGPANFRSRGASAWTHNFFMYAARLRMRARHLTPVIRGHGGMHAIRYEEDGKVSKREFHIVPWDLDNSWITPGAPRANGTRAHGLTGNGRSHTHACGTPSTLDHGIANAVHLTHCRLRVVHHRSTASVRRARLRILRAASVERDVFRLGPQPSDVPRAVLLQLRRNRRQRLLGGRQRRAMHMQSGVA